MTEAQSAVSELEIRGMTCSGCTNAVSRALHTVAGVTAVAVDLATGRARVEGTADPAALERAIERAGFDVVPAPAAHRHG